MFKENDARIIALGVIVKDDKLLVSKGFDKVKGTYFYRCLGGGMEDIDNNSPKNTVIREFREEMNLKITVNKEIAVIDNKFIYNGKQGHEIVHLMDININDEDIKDSYDAKDDDGSIDKAIWINIEDFKSRKKILYPSEFIKYL